MNQHVLNWQDEFKTIKNNFLVLPLFGQLSLMCIVIIQYYHTLEYFVCSNCHCKKCKLKIINTEVNISTMISRRNLCFSRIGRFQCLIFMPRVKYRGFRAANGCTWKLKSSNKSLQGDGEGRKIFNRMSHY